MQTKQDGRLGTEKIGKLMLELALPSVLAQIVNVLYNIVDRIYIGRIPDVGSLALTGVGVTFPIITIISAFAGFASGGGAPLAAIALGQKNRDRAEKILGSSTSLLLFFSVCLMAFFFFFQTPLLYLFGASSNTILLSAVRDTHARPCAPFSLALLSTLVLTRFSSSFFIWVFPGPHLLPFSPRL